MEQIGLNGEHWYPLARFGIQNQFFAFNKETLINTWIVLLILTFLCLIIRFFITKKTSVIRYITIFSLNSFIELTEQTFGTFIYRHFALISALFIFILACNYISILPWAEEPTRDLNTTLALGIVAFLYKERETIRARGFWGYIKEFFTPFFVMLPLNIISHLSKVISISFRLFGNIFGGSIITHIYHSALSGSVLFQTIGIISGLNLTVLVFFGLFEGFIQAFVFAMLTLTYLSIAIQPIDEE